jgi:hypothetical protein
MEARLEQTLVSLLRVTDGERAMVTEVRSTPAVEVVLSSRSSIIFPAFDRDEAAEVLDRALRLVRPAEPA